MSDGYGYAKCEFFLFFFSSFFVGFYRICKCGFAIMAEFMIFIWIWERSGTYSAWFMVLNMLIGNCFLLEEAL